MIFKVYVKLIEDLFIKGMKVEIIYGCLFDIEKVYSDLWKCLLLFVFRMVF